MRLSLLACLLMLVACGQQASKRKNIPVAGSGEKVVLVTGLDSSEELKQAALAQGLKVEGDVIVKITGDADAIRSLEIDSAAVTALDAAIAKSKEEAFVPHEGSLYLAKKDFGLLEFWQTNPKADGRGVIVGVFDDGISAHQSAFKVTSTGERKLLRKGSNSTQTIFTLNQTESGFEGDVVETSGTSSVDLNGDKKFDSFKARVTDKICLDLNRDGHFAETECKGAFSATGEYFMLPGTVMSVVAEFDQTTGKLQISQPEQSGDSHGEGVAAVMAGFNQGGIKGMDGVAPGAQIVDIDISEKSDKINEEEYTIGNILFALEYLAKNGAEVANISYSLFFSSVESQEFMSRAIDALVRKYNIVFSFSAGNNGPGLGSLNRRVMYPDSVLVAGAFVSKELDARVWGVSGLPEEGRVVYYSSRGPGPLGEGGPLMISPLSSLTHSDPAAGFRAFNGTSSASPALAGAAATLISAIKQAGLKVDAPTVVQAMRLSGKRLKAEPFVAQGYGLPQVGTALSIYKELIQGQKFANVIIRANRGAQDNIGGRGILLYSSNSAPVESARVDLSGVLSSLAPLEAKTELLVPVKLEYSKGITGSEELWIAVSTSRLYVDINVAEALEGANGEAFGEIKIKDARSGELMAIVPVTVLDDKAATVHNRARVKVGSQGSARLHFNVPAGVPAVRIKARLIEGDVTGLSISTFDSHRVRTQQVAFTEETWLQVERKGHHQVALALNGGAGREAIVEFDVEPMNLEIRSNVTFAGAPAVNIRHTGFSNLYANLELVPKAAVLAEALAQGGEIKALEAKLELSAKGKYSLSMMAMKQADTGYFYGNCTAKVTNEKGETELVWDAYTLSENKTVSMSARCTPFDQGISKDNQLGFIMRVLRTFDPVATTSAIMAPKATKDFSFNVKAEKGTYEVWVKHPLTGARVKLGNVDLI